MTRSRTKEKASSAFLSSSNPPLKNKPKHTPRKFKFSAQPAPKNNPTFPNIIKSPPPQRQIIIEKDPFGKPAFLYFSCLLPLHLSASTISSILFLYKNPTVCFLPPAGAMLSEQPNMQEQQQKLLNGSDEEEEEEEALSLSDLPILGPHHPSERDDGARQPEPEDFEFGSWAEDPLMCSADDVFFQGQILPLRPSVSSDTALLAAYSRPDSQKSSRSASRSDSMDHSSWGFSSSRSSSNGSSSRRSGHSQQSNPAGSSAYSFYSHHPSPKPQLGGVHVRRSPCRGRSSWDLFRLGLVKTPEIELGELRRRRSSGSGPKYVRGRRDKDGNASKVGDEGTPRFRWSRGLSCKCSAAAVETVSSRMVVLRGKKGVLEERERCNGKREISRRRTFEWLKQLSIAEAPVA